MIATGTGFDAHRLVQGRRLVLGGVEIKWDMGLAGHSDADVLTHAVADALLGAISAGDIGRHFPDTDAQWKDARSLDILESVAKMVSDSGAVILHVDSTVIAEQPKLAPFIDEMRGNLASAMGVALGSVSVKATTVEKMGALGRGEGIAAMAIATVEK